MATYKVLQDIEAEDKFVGPLTLKQFILAGVTAVSGYISFFLLSKNLWFLALPLIPVILVSGFLAFPWGRDQPTEIWLLAKLRFLLKPRRRVWDQTGMEELVSITAPKREIVYSGDNLSQTEVKSRLKALAETIDSRGWAVKNASVNLYNQPAYADTHQTTDRLMDLSDFAHEVPNVDVQASDDILDERSNPTAQHLEQMIAESTQAHLEQTIHKMKEVTKKRPQKSQNSKAKPTHKPPDFWFMHQPVPAKAPAGYTTFGDDKTVTPGSHDDSQASSAALSSDEQKLLQKLHRQHDNPSVAYGHTRVIEPLSTKHNTRRTQRTTNRYKSTSRNQPSPAILELAGNDDLTVATLARQANKKKPSADDEVVVNLR